MDITHIIQTIGAPLGIVLTISVLSYILFGDNPLYKLALHIFIGALAGYSFGVVAQKIATVLLRDLPSERLLLVPLLLGLWLLVFKSAPRLSYIGNFAMAYLVGVGTAVALGGALVGTLVPQVGATVSALDHKTLLDGSLTILGTVATLMAFNFTRSESGAWTRVLGLAAWVGRLFLIFAFGVAFAGALTTSLSILIGRLQYIIIPLVNLWGR